MKGRRAKITHNAITQQAIDIYKVAIQLERGGVSQDDERFREVSLALHRALNLRPWDPFVLEVRLDDIPDPHLEPMMRKSYQRSIDIRRALALAVHQGHRR